MEIDLKIAFENRSALLKKDVLNVLFVGGERNYGFGKITLDKLVENKSPFIFKESNREEECNLKLDADNPIIKSDVAFAHLHLKDLDLKKEFSGEIEPIVGLEWSEKGAGQNISEPVICITPGSKISGKLHCFGIWYAEIYQRIKFIIFQRKANT